MRQRTGCRARFQQSKHYYDLAAENGHSSSQYNLGSLYYHGLGDVVDYNKARHYFELAAQQRDTDAHITLACLYVKGDGVEQDYEKRTALLGTSSRIK
jgi:TPR repeat protein